MKRLISAIAAFLLLVVTGSCLHCKKHPDEIVAGKIFDEANPLLIYYIHAGEITRAVQLINTCPASCFVYKCGKITPLAAAVSMSKFYDCNELINLMLKNGANPNYGSPSALDIAQGIHGFNLIQFDINNNESDEIEKKSMEFTLLWEEYYKEQPRNDPEFRIKMMGQLVANYEKPITDPMIYPPPTCLDVDSVIFFNKTKISNPTKKQRQLYCLAKIINETSSRYFHTKSYMNLWQMTSFPKDHYMTAIKMNCEEFKLRLSQSR